MTKKEVKDATKYVEDSIAVVFEKVSETSNACRKLSKENNTNGLSYAEGMEAAYSNIQDELVGIENYNAEVMPKDATDPEQFLEGYFQANQEAAKMLNIDVPVSLQYPATIADIKELLKVITDKDVNYDEMTESFYYTRIIQTNPNTQVSTKQIVLQLNAEGQLIMNIPHCNIRFIQAIVNYYLAQYSKKKEV